jgi:hypothetical protein
MCIQVFHKSFCVLVVLHVLMCQRKQRQSWIPKIVKNILAIVKRLRGTNYITLQAIMLSSVVIGENPLRCITKDEKGLVLIMFISFIF